MLLLQSGAENDGNGWEIMWVGFGVGRGSGSVWGKIV